jgi:tetratricopeptide (TPR) repeat protein
MANVLEDSEGGHSNDSDDSEEGTMSPSRESNWDRAEWHKQNGDAHFREDKFVEALNDYDQSLRLNPENQKNCSVRLQVMKCLFQMGLYAHCISQPYKDLIPDCSGDDLYPLILCCAEAYWELGHLGYAMKYCEEAHKMAKSAESKQKVNELLVELKERKENIIAARERGDSRFVVKE